MIKDAPSDATALAGPRASAPCNALRPVPLSALAAFQPVQQTIVKERNRAIVAASGQARPFCLAEP